MDKLKFMDSVIKKRSKKIKENVDRLKTFLPKKRKPKRNKKKKAQPKD